MSNRLCPSCLMPDAGSPACPHCGWREGGAPANPLYLPPGTELNPPYRLARVLGHGGFGITYLGWDANLQIKVAIKEYLPREFATRDPRNGQIVTYAGDAGRHFESGLSGFLDEARTLARFQQHPGIVSVLAFFRAYGTGYMVMEYVEGETLKSYLQRRQGRLNWRQTLEIFLQIMDALRAVHQAGLLHRDIAPDNIYLCGDGRVKLLDFGSARQSLGDDSGSLVLIKPGFTPEEQYRSGGGEGVWSDVYSVAASMYYCLTGQAPPDALDRLANDTLKPPSALGVAIPPVAEQALLAALAVSATQRCSSIEVLQNQLLNLQASQSVPPIKIPADIMLRPRRTAAIFHWRRWFIAAMVAMTLLMFAYQVMRNNRSVAVPDMAVPRTEDNAPPPADAVQGIDPDRQRQLERLAAEELKQQQAAALQRFEERRRQEEAQPSQPRQDPRQLEHWRSLCNEWGATMDCNNPPGTAGSR